jgi:endonuclease/exonuclease/phosphatase family metal-dependent hydrolase
VVTWNTHVGGGRPRSLLASLEERDSDPRTGTVLLLQETFRSGDAVPARVPSGGSLPDAIRPRERTDDIAALAAATNMFLAYVPSMRNGHGADDREDRGSAILSSEPLRDVTAIELPFGKQRRVAVMATVAPRGRTASSLRVVAGHVDTPSANLNQAESLAAYLEQEVTSGLPIVLGIDTNAAWGMNDPTVKALDRVLRVQRRCGGGPTSPWLARVDFFFTNLPSTLTHRCETVSDKFGSDHRPVILTIEF